MSLIDNLKEKALSAITDEDKQKEWIEKGFDSAIGEGRKLLPVGDDEGELKAVRESAEYALNKLEKHKGTLVKLGQHGLRSTLSMLALGDYDGAARHAALITLRETASWDEVSSTIVTTAEAGNEAKRELDAEIKAITDALKDIGITAAKSLLPIFLALI
jgi:hypothetical protein